MSFSSNAKRELSSLKYAGAPENALYLRALFLERGTVTNPELGYHLEFACSCAQDAHNLAAFLIGLEEFRVTPGVTRRKEQYVVYVKDSEQITDLLAYIGANQSAMELMQIKMVKEVRNYVNRKNNFETANIEKTASAAAAQLKAIQTIKRTKGFQSLPDELRELAELRLENPEYSLRELGEALSTPISRSGVNHRLQRLLELAGTVE